MKTFLYLIIIISAARTPLRAQEIPVINVAPQTTITIANADLINRANVPDHLSTNQRIEQMAWLPTHQWKQKIIEFDAYQLKLYFQSLSKEQIDRDLNRFVTPDDKQAFVTQLTSDKQNLFHLMTAPSSPSAAGKSYWCLMTVASIAITYAALYTRICHLKKQVARATSWAFWHIDVPLDALREIPTEDLETTLRTAIIDAYPSPDNDHSLFQALTTCLHDIKQELRDHSELRTIYQWIIQLHLTALFPKQYPCILQIKEQEARLLFLTDIINTRITS